MNRIGVASSALVVLWISSASAHDLTAANVPAPLNDATIVLRLKALGYSDVAIVQEGENLVDVELQSKGHKYRLTVSRSLFGKGSLAAYDTARYVEENLRLAE